MTKQHKCGSCANSFGTEQEYAGHVCGKTGHKPTEPEHLGPQFNRISQAAIARGEARKTK